MRNKIFVTAGLILFALTAVWHFVLVPRWTERIPAGWHWEANYIGHQTYLDPATGTVPQEDMPTTYRQTIDIIDNSHQSSSLQLNARYSIRDIRTGKVTWEYDYIAAVDPRTGAHLNPEYIGDYFLFPRNVERTTYKLRVNYLKGVPVAFQREEDVVGLAAYLFTYHGRGEYTESYVGTAEYQGVHVKPGQEIKCADDQFVFKVWVEPVTGEILKIEEGCPATDYIYEIASGKQIEAIDRWSGETAGNDVVNRVETVTSERTRLLWQTRYIPYSLLVAGLLCFGLVLLPKKASHK
jgi:hypothetical protein